MEIIDKKRIRIYLNALPPLSEREEYFAENLTKTARLTVKNCTFGHSMGRGILCSTPKKCVIESNLFERVEGTLVLLAPDCNEWYESSPARLVIFKRNRVVGCCAGVDKKGRAILTVAPHVIDGNFEGYVHERVICKDNVFVDGALGYAFDLSHIKRLDLLRNSFDGEVRVNKKYVKEVNKK